MEGEPVLVHTPLFQWTLMASDPTDRDSMGTEGSTEVSCCYDCLWLLTSSPFLIMENKGSQLLKMNQGSHSDLVAAANIPESISNI